MGAAWSSGALDNGPVTEDLPLIASPLNPLPPRSCRRDGCGHLKRRHSGKGHFDRCKACSCTAYVDLTDLPDRKDVMIEYFRSAIDYH